MSEETRNINNAEGETVEDEFEVLMARFLWDELDEAGLQRLDVIVEDSPDFARRRREYTETRSFFQKAPGVSLRGLDIIAASGDFTTGKGADLSDDELLDDVPPELANYQPPVTGGESKSKVVSLEGRRSRKKQFVGGGLAAAAALVLGLGIFYYARGDAPTHTITMSLGDCRSGQTVLKAGAHPQANRITSGAKSVCDIQFHGASSVAVRLEPNTLLSYTMTGASAGKTAGSDLLLHLHKGRILVNAERTSQSRSIAVYTPGHLVRVLGTRLVVDRGRKDAVRVQLVDGRAEVVAANYLYLPALRRGVAPGVQAKLEKKLPELFRAERREMAPGTYVRITRTAGFDEKNRLLFRRLNELLEKSAGSGASASLGPDAGALERLRSRLDRSPATEKNALLVPPGVDKGRDSRYHALKLKRRFETFHILKANDLEPEVLERRKIERERILKSVRKATDEPTYIYRVHLKGGKIHTGLLEQVGNDYRLFTGERGIMIRKKDVEKIELVVDE